jgi:hypothetical protein
MSERIEIRVGYYGGLICSSEQIKALRFKLEMEQHYRQQQEEHALLIYALKLKAASFRWYMPWTWL